MLHNKLCNFHYFLVSIIRISDYNIIIDRAFNGIQYIPKIGNIHGERFFISKISVKNHLKTVRKKNQTSRPTFHVVPKKKTVSLRIRNNDGSH